MPKENNKALWFVVMGLEIIVIAALVFYFDFFSADSETASVTPISRNNISKLESSNLDHYYSLKPGQWTEASKPGWLADYPDVFINKDGLNDRFNYSAQNPEDTYRIVALGDSWTFGMYVDTEDSYPEQLEEYLSQNCTGSRVSEFEVLNLGVGGYNVAYSAERFRNKGDKYNPDLILWLTFNNDFSDQLDLLTEKSMEYREDVIKDYYLSNVSDSLPEREEINWKNYIPQSKLSSITRESWKMARENLRNEYSEKELVDIQADVLNRFASDYDLPIMLLTLPGDGRALTDYQSGVVGELVRSNPNLLHEGLNINLSSSEIFPDTHPNAKGYDKIAKEVGRILKERDLIDC